MAHHDAAGGTERLWQILAAAPPSSAMIMQPAAYQVPWPPREDLTAALQGLTDRLGNGKWTVARGSVGELQLRAENLGAEQALAAVLPGFRGGNFLEAYGPSPVLRTSILALAFVDAATAAQFVATAEAAAQKDADQLRVKADPEGKVTFRHDAAPPVMGATGRRFAQTPPPGFSLLLHGELIWLQRGRHVVQFTSSTVTMEDSAISELAGTIFRRLELH